MTDADLWVLPAWTNPFMPLVDEPTLDPWASPGRVSVAPEPTHGDRLTWGAAAFAALNPGHPVYRLTVRDRLWCYLAGQAGALWSLPPNPLETPEWLRRQRLRTLELVADDPALRLSRRR
ncbi:hypothetical protein [Nocardia sp. NBC_01009]|uniref:hypothetical protein n=1 Tax=Nocardia sp. NBC_01009 TaxID=2975996 RepID=UPI00386B5031|nr:hypothetical protein OHA42_05025 [Nocardia sp. NBC_01009]